MRPDPALRPIADDPARFDAEQADQRVLLRAASWGDYQRLDQLRGESAVPRLTFLHGALELTSPGFPHETEEKTLARIIEAWAGLIGIELAGAGSWALKDSTKGLGAEVDECYLIWPLDGESERPDIAIEVIKTSGGIDKLAVFRGLGVPEVWFWKRGRLSFHRLEADGYRQVERSAKLPGLNPAVVAECMAAQSQTAAVQLLRERHAD